MQIKLLKLNSKPVGLFNFFKKTKSYFHPHDMERIVVAIRNAERRTSGEIRIYIESKNPLVNVLERAAEVFYNLKMEQTDHRNAVLLYIAMDHHEVALFADEGIYKKAGGAYWEKEMEEMLAHFKTNNIPEGIVNCVAHIGETLCKEFPYDAENDRNELPDEIVFGK